MVLTRPDHVLVLAPGSRGGSPSAFRRLPASIATYPQPLPRAQKGMWPFGPIPTRSLANPGGQFLNIW
jgi:hypothetical protein